MRRMMTILLMTATPALASSGDAWEEMRQQIETDCLALVDAPDSAEVQIEVNPFGSESHGAALVEVTYAEGTDRMICITDKQSGAAELTAPFTPAE